MAKLTLTYHFDTEDELRSHLLSETRTAAVTETPVAPKVIETVDEETGEVREVDVDGFPWDAELHTETRSVNADGRFRAKRGKAEAEAAARAAWKAKGATTTEVEPPAAAMPAAVAMPAMPTMPAAAVTVQPRSLDVLVSRISGLMGGGLLSMDHLSRLYTEAGSADPNAYATNETLRQNLWGLLDRDFAAK